MLRQTTVLLKWPSYLLMYLQTDKYVSMYVYVCIHIWVIYKSTCTYEWKWEEGTIKDHILADVHMNTTVNT